MLIVEGKKPGFEKIRTPPNEGHGHEPLTINHDPYAPTPNIEQGMLIVEGKKPRFEKIRTPPNEGHGHDPSTMIHMPQHRISNKEC